MSHHSNCWRVFRGKGGDLDEILSELNILKVLSLDSHLSVKIVMGRTYI
jgi:hypothetical protein